MILSPRYDSSRVRQRRRIGGAPEHSKQADSAAPDDGP